MNTAPAPIQHNRRAAVQVERELLELQRQAQEQLPDLLPLEVAIQRWAVETTLDEAFKPELRSAVEALRAAKAAWAERGRLNVEIKLLSNELNELRAAERMERIEIADKRLNRAVEHYRASCVVAAKALRSVLDQQSRSAQIPGASSNIASLRLQEFHIPHLIPMSWSGSLGRTMIEGGTQSFELD